MHRQYYEVAKLITDTSKITIHQYVSSNTDSPLSWHLAREWLKKCSASHPCTLKMDKRFPSRLIQVTGTSRADLRARLVLSAGLGANTKYCTLSHCWGSSPIIKLQKANLVGFLSDIPIFELSKTFQDAMYAVIQLGFSFIWIDSLCIIQDRREDWLHEASLMSSVYANSSLNLAATAAADGRAGLFFSRNPASIKAGYITASGALRNGYVIANRQLWNQSIEHGPLAKRAWVLQERFLAPRTLHFASNQLFWECGQVSCCEMFPFIDLNHTFLPLFFGSALKGHIGTVHWWRTWRSIMEHYSRSLLTKEEDKLFAMAGMATHFHSLTGDKYLAGLWLKGIEKQLLWSSPYGHNSRQQSRSPVNTRPSSYRAPSWSWASLDGPV
ncbi:HET-domain-containing protein, partial [Stipitochalara longipes BDJ]